LHPQGGDQSSRIFTLMFSVLKKWLQRSEPEEVQKTTDPITASLVLMLEVAWSDHEIDSDEEKAILQAINKTFDLDTEEAKAHFIQAKTLHQQSVGSYEYTSLINDQMTYDEKKNIIHTLWQIANSDQYIDQWEEHAIRKIADLLYIDHRDFIDAKIETKRGKL